MVKELKQTFQMSKTKTHWMGRVSRDSYLSQSRFQGLESIPADHSPLDPGYPKNNANFSLEPVLEPNPGIIEMSAETDALCVHLK